MGPFFCDCWGIMWRLDRTFTDRGDCRYGHLCAAGDQAICSD